jgi:uncharacterized iron-regulated protein
MLRTTSFFALIVFTACATAPAENTAAESKMPAGHGIRAHNFSLPRKIVDGKTGEILGDREFYASAGAARVIYISEQHNNPHHHAAQLSLIAGIFTNNSSIAIGLEMIKRPFQQALDDYLAGTIDEAEMLLRTEWDDRWGYSFLLYREIFEFARAHKIPLYALNAPEELTKTVAGGGLEALTPDQRASLPDLDLTSEDHREMLKEAFGAHHHHHAGKFNFENFYAAQVIWDETMGYEVARILKAPGGPTQVIVLAGDGHIREGLGIPDRAARRGAEPYVTVLPIMASELEAALEDEAGDYLWVMSRN